MAESDFIKTLEIPSTIVDGIRYPDKMPRVNFDAARNYRAQDNDIVLTTYPKCGTTWTQYIMCHLLNYGEFDGDATSAKKLCPYLEMFGIESLKPGSFYKIHLPFNAETFNPNARYVLVVRDPKDVAVSYYHFTSQVLQGIPGLPKDANWFSRFAELFVKGEVWNGDYMEYHRDWLDGLRKHGKPENILIVVYEKMKKDPRGELIRIANFLGGKAAELVKDEKVIETILDKTSVKSMKETVNTSVGKLLTKLDPSKPAPKIVEFVRKGVVGDHVNYFTPEIFKMFDDYAASDPRNKEIMDMFNV